MMSNTYYHDNKITLTMKRIICLFALLTSLVVVQAQNVDSLLNVLNTKELSVDEKLELYMKICQQYMLNSPEQHKKYADLGLVLAEKGKNITMCCAFNGNLGIYYFCKASYDTAKVYIEKALDLAIKAKNKNMEANLYTNLALIYSRQGDFAAEQEYNLKALSIFEKTDNKKNFITLLVNIGTTYRSLTDYERAMYYIERAKALAEETDYLHGKLIVYYALANNYNDNEEYDKSLEYYLKSIELSKEENNVDFEALCAQSLSTLYLEKYGDLDNAEKYANESLRLAEEFGGPFRFHGTWTVLSNVYLYQKRYKESIDIALKAWAIDSTDLDISPGLATIIATSYIHLGNKNKAEYFLDKYIDINGQKNKKSLQETLIGMEVKYETEKKELRIASLEKEKQLYIWLSVAGGVVLLLAFGMLFYRHRMNVQKRQVAEQQREIAEQQRELAERKIKQLEQEKQLIAAQAELDGEAAERSRLARDLHDGLGGLLSVVKLNLKDMKSYTVMDGTDVDRFGMALDVLDESIGELRRVAHHLMPESLMRYGLRVSLEDYCRAIPVANFQYYGDDERLDSRLEVLIYRCTYELVNNAVKYATATAIDVQLMTDNGLVSLTVRDNGCGFDPGKVTDGAGLENIRTRVSAYNGKMGIHAAPGEGTEVSIEIVKSEE